MKIAMIEPFYSGSHQKWMDEYKAVSQHTIQTYTMPGRFWKWRMHGGAVELAKQFLANTFEPDIILASDMLDLSTFLGLTRSKSNKAKVVMYCHENQLTYPWSTIDQDRVNRTDAFYSFINYMSALVADAVLFNSEYHRRSFLKTLPSFLKQFPDYQGLDNVERIKLKTSVLPLGLNLHKFDDIEREQCNRDVPLILWNHRWEFDKNPESFFNVLFKLADKGKGFHLAVIGQNTARKAPSIFIKAEQRLADYIVQFGHVESARGYGKLLKQADILPVTSNQEFFGISVMEAVYCGATPLLPKRLSYPELFNMDERPQLFYESDDELVEKLCKQIDDWNEHKNSQYINIAAQYDWRIMAAVYDEKFQRIMEER